MTIDTGISSDTRVPTSVVYLSLRSGSQHFYEQGTLYWGMCWSIRSILKTTTCRTGLHKQKEPALLYSLPKIYEQCCLNGHIVVQQTLSEYWIVFWRFWPLEKSFSITVVKGILCTQREKNNHVFFANTHMYDKMSRVLYAWVFQVWACISPQRQW